MFLIFINKRYQNRLVKKKKKNCRNKKHVLKFREGKQISCYTLLKFKTQISARERERERDRELDGDDE